MTYFRFCFAFALLAAPLAACSQPQTDDSDENTGELAYGNDDRTEVFAHEDERLRGVAQSSVVALIEKRALDFRNPNELTYRHETLKEAQGLCDGERFAEQPTVADCSGALIADDLVLTAGHCFESEQGESPVDVCRQRVFAFGYHYDGPATLHKLTADATFGCAELLAFENHDVNAPPPRLDYAIVRLDRPATPRFHPLRIEDARPVAVGRALAVIGAPSGLPLKIDSGGVTKDPRAGQLDFFTANLDTFAGNSGSAVIDRNTHAVLGILVRGARNADDYIRRGACNVVNRCRDDGCNGFREQVTYVGRAVDALCRARPNAPLCVR